MQCFIISIGLLNNLAFQFYTSAENLKQKIDFLFVKHASASGGSSPPDPAPDQRALRLNPTGAKAPDPHIGRVTGGRTSLLPVY